MKFHPLGDGGGEGGRGGGEGEGGGGGGGGVLQYIGQCLYVRWFCVCMFAGFVSVCSLVLSPFLRLVYLFDPFCDLHSLFL